MKTADDFRPEELKWLIDDWFPLGHRGMDTAPEGSFKTMNGLYIAVCVASGNNYFGHEVTQGPVLLIDEETPEASVNNHLVRFSKGFGLKLEDLPIYRLHMTGFRFGRKEQLKKILKWVETIKPVFIRMDSMLAMLPTGREGIGENDSHIGETIRDDLIAILKTAGPNSCSILLSAHAKKSLGPSSIQDLMDYDMSMIVRGHGSIVGEGCDTGYIIKRISERDPTRYCIMVRPRRQAIPSGKPMLIEMKEEKYGKGWARLVEIDQRKLPPSKSAMALFPLFIVKDRHGYYESYKEDKIIRTCALINRNECREGLIELWNRRVIVQGDHVRSYVLNPLLENEVDPEYLAILRNASGKLYL